METGGGDGDLGVIRGPFMAVSAVSGGSLVDLWAYLTGTSCGRLRLVAGFDGGPSEFGRRS